MVIVFLPRFFALDHFRAEDVAAWIGASVGVTLLLCLIVGWLLVRQGAELAAGRLRTEMDAALRVEAVARASAEERASAVPQLELALREQQREAVFLQSRNAELEVRLEEESKAHDAQLSILERAREELSDAFRALSADALRQNNQSFLTLAGATLEKFQEAARGDLDRRQQAIDSLVSPVRESLEKFDGKINDLERARVGAYESLTAQVHSLVDLQHQLRGETSNLVNALRRPNVRGRWGEIQLRRVVELAGMLNYCDFTEQTSLQTEDGRLRPDLLVRLPAGKTVVVDAKAPIDAYFDSARSLDEAERAVFLRRHAGSIRSHVETLTRKAYWEQFANAPEFVVLFLPGENFFSAALEHDPSLIEFGVERKIIIATPTTLISLLRAVFYGWRQETLARNAQVICTLGRDLYKRLATLGEHFERLGRSLDGATQAYNQAVGSLESRVLVTARRFRELDATDATEADIPIVEPLDQSARRLQANEWNADEAR